MIDMIRGFIALIAAPIAVLAATQARAELTLCNRTSFRMEAAAGIEKRANVVTRGWYHLDPGQCRQVMDGTLDADMVYLHARTPSVYGAAPLPQNGDADFCIRNSNFEIANARGCPASQQAHFNRPNRQKGRSSISRKKPTTMTPRRSLPGSSACS
ncbi:MAG: DUF1036 domain-containing protein [Pseudolabrys sp.]